VAFWFDEPSNASLWSTSAFRRFLDCQTSFARSRALESLFFDLRQLRSWQENAWGTENTRPQTQPWDQAGDRSIVRTWTLV
jgi:hypothetical protein